MNKKKIAILIIFILILSIGAGVWYFLKNGLIISRMKDRVAIKETNTSHGGCLETGEVAEYEIFKKLEKVSVAKIIVRNIDTHHEISSFEIELPIPDHYHPVELHKCHIYTTKSFGYDYKSKRALPDYRLELWGYQYDGDGGSVVYLSGPVSGSGYGTDFRVDPSETYVVLEKSYLGNPDYALVIKSLSTKEDALVLPLKNIIDRYPSLGGSFGMNQWTKDGRYFWANIFDGANVLAFLRIEKGTWKYDVFPAPKGTMGGDALNAELGYITYDTGASWTGDVEFDKKIKEDWRAQGKKVSFYVYDLPTKSEKLLATIDDPIWHFQPQWISDHELQYTLPDGEKKIFRVE